MRFVRELQDARIWSSQVIDAMTELNTVKSQVFTIADQSDVITKTRRWIEALIDNQNLNVNRLKFY